MRVTNNMMNANLLYNLNRNLEYMNRKSEDQTTGKKVHRPSDDPVAIASILERRTDLSEISQYRKNASDAMGWLTIAEKALEDNGELFQKIRELVVQASNGTNSADDTRKIKSEIINLKQQIISNGNTSYAGRYIFSGFETDKKLLNKDGTYNIDVDDYAMNNKPKAKIEVFHGESVDIMNSGLEIYGVKPETNFLNSSMPSGTAEGTIAQQGYIQGLFDFEQDYTAADLDVTVNGVTYAVDESALSNPVDKEILINALENGVNGGNTLSDVADVYFNKDNELVIKAKNYGEDVTIAGGFSPTTVVAGNPTVEATVGGATFGAATFTQERINLLRESNISITVGGYNRKIRPKDPFTNATEYAASLQAAADLAFGPNTVSITEAAGAVTFSTVNTQDGIKPEIIVDYPKTNKSEMLSDLDDIIEYLDNGDHENLTASIANIDKHMNTILTIRADIGARTNRIEMIENKLSSNELGYKKLLSDVEDADMAKVIMELKMAENVYRASLSSGSRIIQASLVDFIK